MQNNRINQRKAGAILSYINLAISCVIPLLYTPIMLDMLGQEEYGLYSLSNSVISYLGLLNLGMGTAIVRYIIRYRAAGETQKVRQMFGLFITIYSILAILVCIGGSILIYVSGSMFGRGLTPEEIDKLRILIVVMTISMAVSFPLGTFASVTVACEEYIYNKSICVTETILNPVLNLVVLYAGQGSVGLALVGLLIQLANGALYGIYCWKRLNLYPVFRNMPTSCLKELAGFCAFVFISSIVDMLYWATDKVLIGAVLGPAAVAVYNIGGTFNAMLQSMSSAISSVFSPKVNMMVVQQVPKTKLSALLIRVGRIQYLVISLVLSGYVVFGKNFIRLWAGEEYGDAYYIALLTMIPLAIPLIQNIAFTTILAENKHRFRSILYAIIAVINVVSTYLILPYWGIIGAAVCTAVSFVVGNGIIINIYYYKVTRLDVISFWKNIAQQTIVPGILIVIGDALVRYVLPMESLWWFLLWVMVYSVIFAVLTWVFSMNGYEKELILSFARKLRPPLRET